MAKLRTVAHEILGEALYGSRTTWVLTYFLGTEGKGLVLMVKSADCLGILLEVPFLAWDSLLLGLLKVTGHAKNMVLLNGLPVGSVFCLTEFGGFEANGATVGVLGQFVTV
jgi:hypothetical protein